MEKQLKLFRRDKMKKKVYRERYYGETKEQSPVKSGKSPVKGGRKTKKGDK